MATLRSTTRTSRTPRDAVRTEVIAAVARLLGDGERYSTLGVQQICTEAGVARSAFYVNFADKTDLLLRVIESVAEDITPIAEQWLSSEPTLDLEPLIAALERSITAFRKHAGLLDAYAEVSAAEDRLASFWQTWMEEIISSMRLRVIHGQQTGEIRGDLDADTCARFIILGAERVMREHAKRDDGGGDAHMAAEFGRAAWVMLHAT